VAGAYLAALYAGLACAQALKAASDYPTRVVRWVVPYPPGASNDVVARAGGKAYAGLGPAVVIDNRNGAGGLIGADIVAYKGAAPAIAAIIGG
jgi:tripartite-type tricarboxylate transporter receptor subunit TctC